MAKDDFPELTKMFASSFALPVSQAQGRAQSVNDQISISNAKQAESEAKARAAAFSNKNNYTVVQRPDGGFGFYGPDGKEVTAATYANNTGQDITKVLKDSLNPIDQRYIADHNDLTAYLKAKSQSGFDNKQKAIAGKYEDLVKGMYGDQFDLSKINPTQAVQALQNNYPTIYGGHTAGWSGSNLALPTQEQVNAEVKTQYPTGFGNISSTTSGGQGVQ